MNAIFGPKRGFDGATDVNLMQQKLGGRERREPAAFRITVTPSNVATRVWVSYAYYTIDEVKIKDYVTANKSPHCRLKGDKPL
jgi:hypothetical protein